MRTPDQPFALPAGLTADLTRVLAYWDGLKRGEAEMPFWDDVNLSALPDMAASLMLIEVLQKPVRFRFGFGVIGEHIKRQYGGDLSGKFSDEVEARHPLQFLNSQLSATVEARRPTHYTQPHAADGGLRGERGFSRLILPLWGDGHVGMLLGAFSWR